MTDEELLGCALDIGERMVVCGAEIWRVEDSVTRICRAGGAQRVDVFSITSTIIATIWVPGRPGVTQCRRILRRETDLNRLDRLNALSRQICAGETTPDMIRAAIADIDRARAYRPWTQYAMFALISAVFSAFFGGSPRDALASGAIGLVLKAMDGGVKRARLNALLSNLLCAAACGALAIFAVRLNLSDSVDKVMIGNIMPLIPGVALVNATRDLFGGDLISGLLRLVDAILLAVSIALGFALAWTALGGIL